MATHAIGKLKFNLSKKGLAYRWGEGEIKQLFGKKASENDEADTIEYEDGVENYDDPGFDDADYPDDGYADDDLSDEYEDDGYQDDDYIDGDDGYQDDGYDGGEYEDDGYADDGYDDDGEYADDGYDDGEYADDGYDDDGYADEGYDDGEYDDDGYYDEGDGYDDRYSDEDADEEYGEDYDENTSPLMRFVSENSWVTYLLLFLLPPLGIYLLWRRGMFEKPVRYAVSAASGVWFVVALALLFSALFGGAKDTSKDPTITLAPSATVSALDLDTSDDGTGLDGEGEGLDLTVDSIPGDTSSDASDTDSEPTVEPSPTPLTGSSSGSSSGSTLSSSAYVYSPATGLYYHSKSDCENIDEGVSLSRVPKDVAENSRKQSACPVCIGATSGDTTTYYATRAGTYYHVDQNCQGMTGAITYTKEAAERAGKTACPVCILKTATSTRTGDVKYVTSSTDDKSNISVYTTKGGKYFHMTSNCSGMTGATRGSLKDALVAGKKACPTCCKAAGTSVYCTKNGTYYHRDKTCSGMKDPLSVTLAEALVLGKKSCPVCIKNSSSVNAATSKLQQESASEDNGAYVYGTAKGTYYHTDPTCSGMKDAQRYTLKSMLLQKRKACPKCASAASTVVYATKGGSYYHSYATCSGMTGASSGTMAEAIAQGYKRCPKCWSSSTSIAGASAKKATSASASNTSTSSTSTGSSTASSTSSQTTKAAASSVTAKATSAPTSTATANNTYVYATKSGAYYHLNSTCSGMKGASRITLKQAVNAGKTPCPTCAGSAKRTVYSNTGGKYYHAASVCKQSGMKNGTAKTLAQALMEGQTACKYCIGSNVSTATAKAAAKAAAETATEKEKEALKKAAAKLVNSHTYTSGKSGIKVYARADNKYYHRLSNCSGMTNASRITLEAALNYGKTACPTCCSAARRTVYATRGGKYYHYSKTHAGSGASSGSLASALAYGYKACPYCVTKTKTLASTNTYKSGTSGIKVYATASNKYYHSKANCSGLKNASYITLETAMNYGKKPCPTCMVTASRKVYSSSADSYYHYYKAHAGSSAKAGTLAQARALGKKLCPQCSKAAAAGITPSQAGVTLAASSGVTPASYSQALSSTDHYSAPADTVVYVDLAGKYYFYYHKSSRCSKTDMTSGSKITLQYARDFGYKACPFCNPPTSVE